MKLLNKHLQSVNLSYNWKFRNNEIIYLNLTNQNIYRYTDYKKAELIYSKLSLFILEFQFELNNSCIESAVRLCSSSNAFVRQSEDHLSITGFKLVIAVVVNLKRGFCMQISQMIKTTRSFELAVLYLKRYYKSYLLSKVGRLELLPLFSLARRKIHFGHYILDPIGRQGQGLNFS